MLALLLEAALRSLALGALVWLGLRLLCVRDPRAHMTAWTIVLVTSLMMPMIMQRWTVHLPAVTQARFEVIMGGSPRAAPVIEAGEEFSPQPHSAVSRPPTAATVRVDVDAHTDVTRDLPEERSGRWVDGLSIATDVYMLVAGILLLRLLVGIVLSWRIVRAARPVGEPWASGNVRVSELLGAPVTFGSTILLPMECTQWSAAKRQAVLAHERSHVVRGDCYVLLIAAVNRAVFWFSPFAWWQFARLSQLAETISDDAAIAAIADHGSYARILLDLAADVRQVPVGLAMARTSTVRRRIERVLAAPGMLPRMGWRGQITVALAVVPIAVLCAGAIFRGAAPPSIAASAAPEASGPPSARPVKADHGLDMTTTVDAQLPNSPVGYYRLDHNSIFAVTRRGNDLFAQMTGTRKQQLAPGADREFFYNEGATRVTFIPEGDGRAGELMLRTNGDVRRGVKVADVPGSVDRNIEVAADVLDRYVGWYELGPFRALTVTREDDRLFVQATGEPKIQLFAHGKKEFMPADGGTVIIFMSDSKDQSAGLLLHEPDRGVRNVVRIDAARAAVIEERFARRLASAPSRFKDQTPAPGSEAALLRAIEDLQQDTPTYDSLSLPLAAAVRRYADDLHATLTALGRAESVFFRGVGPAGYDIYGARFAAGFAEFRLLMGPDGKIDDIVVRPDGDDTPGGFARCPDEPALKSAAGNAPIRLIVYNLSGADVDVFELDPAGKRKFRSAVGDERSALIQTVVGRPLVVVDQSGHCLDIVLPGRLARFLTVQPPQIENAHAAFRRRMPMAGSEGVLRRHIDALGRGEPNYDQMTSEVAAQMRQQAPLERAILAKLGALRALSFRGVSGLDADIYMAQFENGAAEWRIGLVKGGRIGRLALGPQY